MKNLIMVLTLLSSIPALANSISTNRDIFCYSESARARITILLTKGEAYYTGSRSHKIDCRKTSKNINCKMPNGTIISIGKSSIESIERRESTDREIYTLFGITDDAGSFWQCSNSNI
jgi:hypothetical protein